MGKPECVQVDRSVGNVAPREDIGRLTEHGGLPRTHRARNDEQEFRRALQSSAIMPRIENCSVAT